MLPRRLLPGFVLLLVSCGVAAAQSPPVVEFLPPKTVMMTAGFNQPFELTFRIRGGYAIGADRFSDLRATRFEFSPPPGFDVGEFKFPHPERVQFPFQRLPLSVFRGELIVTAAIFAQRGTPPGSYIVRGRLHYQACDNRAAQPPTNLPIEFTVRLLRAGER